MDMNDFMKMFEDRPKPDYTETLKRLRFASRLTCIVTGLELGEIPEPNGWAYEPSLKFTWTHRNPTCAVEANIQLVYSEANDEVTITGNVPWFTIPDVNETYGGWNEPGYFGMMQEIFKV